MSAISTVAALIANEIATPDGPAPAADPTAPAPTPGPFLQLIEQLLQAVLPMLAACIPAIGLQTRVINRPKWLQREQLAATINQVAPANAPKVALLHAMLNVGAKLKQDQVGAMQSEISKP